MKALRRWPCSRHRESLKSTATSQSRHLHALTWIDVVSSSLVAILSFCSANASCFVVPGEGGGGGGAGRSGRQYSRNPRSPIAAFLCCPLQPVTPNSAAGREPQVPLKTQSAALSPPGLTLSMRSSSSASAASLYIESSCSSASLVTPANIEAKFLPPGCFCWCLPSSFAFFTRSAPRSCLEEEAEVGCPGGLAAGAPGRGAAPATAEEEGAAGVRLLFMSACISARRSRSKRNSQRHITPQLSLLTVVSLQRDHDKDFNTCG